MISFEPITKETLYIAFELVNSNAAYNQLETGQETRSNDEVGSEYMQKNTNSLFIKADDTYIGLINYMKENPKDGYPWLGSFMIHSAYHGFGYGTQAYVVFEQYLTEQGISRLRLGVLQQNARARAFWERLGFSFYATKPLVNNVVDCFEKEF
ncbi:GNAT family N-acetyltransferase [Priestia megaterium]|nr:GNAT family N-acetyltransferase [Priestia megaterium]